MVNLSGQRFGRLVAISRGENCGGRVRWNCICDCGVEKIVARATLTAGNANSCGCLRREVVSKRRLKHGQTRGGWSPTYVCWHMMTRRVKDDNPKNAKYYKWQGVTVCDRWLGPQGFINFFADMSERPSMQHTLDRVDPYGNYEPGNCRWATPIEQRHNRRVPR